MCRPPPRPTNQLCVSWEARPAAAPDASEDEMPPHNLDAAAATSFTTEPGVPSVCERRNLVSELSGSNSSSITKAEDVVVRAA